MTARRKKKKAAGRKKLARQGTVRAAKEAKPGDSGRRRKTLFDLPPLELECMKALWSLGEAPVREIREAVNEHHRRLARPKPGLAYTTVETIMDRLTRKRMVTRQKKGRAHHYQALYRLEQARAEGLDTLLNHFFGGSRRNLNTYLAGGKVPAGPAAGSAPARATASETSRGRRSPPQPQIDTSLL